MSQRKICIVTGSRAEYGLLYWLMKEVQDDLELELQLVVTGMHMSPEFGLTYKTIEVDGFPIAEKVEMLMSSDSPVGIAKSLGLGIIGFADAFSRLRPDIVVLLGDRYEILAAAQAALIARMPIAHLHGGETTEGAIDEAIRHAITKMSQMHFVAAEPYRRRVIQLGEDPSRVFNFGSLAVDNINKIKLLDRQELERELNFKFGPESFLITYHPATLGSLDPEKAMLELIKALDAFPKAQLIFTKPNSDTHGRVIQQIIDDYVAMHNGRAIAFNTLGQLRYLSTLKHVNLVLGNSSSGLSEAPLLGTPTVNVGERQRGRLRTLTVLDCSENADEIVLAIRQALSADFVMRAEHNAQRFRSSDVSTRIKEQLKATNLDRLMAKKFYDL